MKPAKNTMPSKKIFDKGIEGSDVKRIIPLHVSSEPCMSRFPSIVLFETFCCY